MEALTQLLWGPWLVYGLPALGLLGWAATRLPTGGSSRVPRGYRTALVASASGLGGVGGVALALEFGGPGALAWMLLALLLGAGLTRAQTRLAMSVSPTKRRPGPLTGLLTVLTAVAAGGLFQSQQAGAIWESAVGLPAWSAGFAIVAALAPALAFSRARAFVISTAPLFVGLYLLGCAAILLRDTNGVLWAVGQVFDDALRYRPVSGGIAGAGATMAILHGSMRAVMVGELGLGVSIAAAKGHEPSPRAAVKTATRVGALTGATMATATALVLLTAPAQPEPLTERVMLPLEIHQSRGLRPSASVGQTVVLPANTSLEADRIYPMVLRSNPRGNGFWRAQMLKDEDAIIVPKFQVLDNLDTVVFRARDNFLADNPAWDVRVKVTRTEFMLGPGVSVWKLVPEDPQINFRKLIVRRQLDKKPYLVADDFHFLGHVARASSPDPELGEHLAMFEVRDDASAENPKLHEFFRAGYRGPYADDGKPRPPFALIGAPELDVSPGVVSSLELRSTPRGANLLAIEKTGALLAPPWDFLLDAREVVFRHNDDPARDVFVPVRASTNEGRLLFRSDDPAWSDFRVAQKMKGFTGPFLITPPYTFEAEARGGARLGEKWEGRTALIPLHEDSEPRGPRETIPYTPHPGEVLATDLAGPFPARGQGSAAVATRFIEELGGLGRLLIVFVGLGLAITTMAAWTTWASSVGSAYGVVALMALAAAVGPTISTARALSWADATLGLLAALGALAVLRGLGRLRQ